MTVDTAQILDAADKLGQLLAQHPAVEKYKTAQKALADDPDASRLLADFNRAIQQVSHNEQAGVPPTEQQRKTLETLQSQIASHLKFKAYSMAEYELTDMMRKVSQAWQKPLAPEPKVGAPAATPAGGGQRLVL